ncbi:hypothetical protein EYB26_005034 [Talaromyces marneffei]|uniref:uncharacterized protein n=1 Tax=Talaromyces marneffei TaxID=37727 RepID=UPI0012A969E0|nr:uncharacterized protein EYB26_005034 [Talaromyces marneffei]QGA17363.1 hypothetical protein EYB26_005034 [Talaromyces marneffei]
MGRILRVSNSERAIISSLHISLACAAHYKHRHRALAQSPTITSSTVTSGVAVANPTNSGSSVPIEIGIDGPIGIVEIGSPGQTIDVQFDTTFDGVLVRSAREDTTDTDNSLVYNSSDSESWSYYIPGSSPENTYTQTLEDDAYAIALAGIETFDIGGKLYSNMAFSQFEQYYQNTSGQAIPFGGTSGSIGLNYNSM